MKRTVRYLTHEEILDIHDLSIERYGGLVGVRDAGLLDSALAQPAQSFDGIELYPTLAEKAARLAYGIIKNHPFVDGNKRTGAAALALLLRMNGIGFTPNLDDMLAIIIAVADGSANLEALTDWTKQQIDE